MTTQLLYTLDAWMFHIQKANQYIKHTTKYLETFTRTVESTERYIFRNFKMCLWSNQMSIAF